MRKLFVLFAMWISGLAYAQGTDVPAMLSGNSYWMYKNTEVQTEKADGSSLVGWKECMYDDGTFAKEAVDGREYSVLRRMTAAAGISSWDAIMKFHVREDGGKVYGIKDEYVQMMSVVFGQEDGLFLEDCGNGEVLLYDFTLGVGDRYPCKGDVTVKAVERLTTHDGMERKLFCLSNGQKILENVGCITAGGELLGYQNTGLGYKIASEDDVYSRVYSFGGLAEFRGVNNELVYEKDDNHQEDMFLDYGKEWVYDGQLAPGIHFNDRYYIDGDTVVDGRTCMRLFSEKRHEYSGDLRKERNYEGGLWEEDEKVFFIPANSTERCLLYDFGLKLGEKAQVSKFDDVKSVMTVTITDIKNLTIGNIERRVFRYACDYPAEGFGGLWIEGIGGHLTLVPLDSNNGFGLQPLTTVSNGGETIDAGAQLRQQWKGERMDYRAMLKDGRHWKYEYHQFEDQDENASKETVFEQDFFLDGDTLIANKLWRKMYCESNGTRTYAGAWIEENAKVYRIAKGDGAEKAETMFDFDMLPYEFCHQQSGGPVFYTHVDTVAVGGTLYLRHNFAPYYQPKTHMTYVEGIGGEGGLDPFPLPVPNCRCDYSQFIGVFDDEGNCVFSVEDFSKDKYVSGIENQKWEAERMNGKGVSNAVYDLQGRQVGQGNKMTEYQGNKLPKGIYIQNGRKFVIK